MTAYSRVLVESIGVKEKYLDLKNWIKYFKERPRQRVGKEEE